MDSSRTILPLALEGVSFAAGGQTLVHDLSLEIAGGSRTIMLGPNGAGKSLILRLCHGLLRPSAGCVVWRGPDAAQGGATQAKRHQAMVFQRPVMLRRSVAANVSYALSLHGIPRGARPAIVDEALDRARLAGLRARPARVLSAGEQQRLALARAWALKPQVLFLDEPTANLDPAASRAVEGIIEAIHNSGTKIVMTTHDLAQARRLADDIIFIHHGRLVERGPAAAFFERPSTEPAMAFIHGELLR